MRAQSLKVFERLYAGAEHAEDLPWHADEPPPLLVKALAQREHAGTALDVGCGAGTYSVFMARHGYRVTALDVMPQAIDMVQRQARELSLYIEAHQTDIATWSTDQQFDIVLDVGCLHTPGSVDYSVYKSQLLKWLAPGGDFILLHFGRRGWWDWWPIGPSRVYPQTIIDLFAPELELVEFVPDHLRKMRPMLGFSALVGKFWFRRSDAAST